MNDVIPNTVSSYTILDEASFASGNLS